MLTPSLPAILRYEATHHEASIYPDTLASKSDELLHYLNELRSPFPGLAPDATINPVTHITELVKQGADLNAVEKKSQETALIMAMGTGNRELIKYLVEKGAQINAADHLGRTALLDAAAYYANGGSWLSKGSAIYGEMIEYLVAHEADVNATANNGSTPLLWTSGAKEIEAAKHLVNHGADVQATDQEGHTALHFLAMKTRSGSRELAEVLVAHGTNPLALDRMGRTALDYAILPQNVNKNRELVTFLTPFARAKRTHTKTQPLKLCLVSALLAGVSLYIFHKYPL